MRYTLSVLTAACLLALGQPAWSLSTDQALQQRARMAAMALPATDRQCATKLLQILQAAAVQDQRRLRLSMVTAAVEQSLHTHHAAALQQHQLPPAAVELHWSKAPAQDLYAHAHPTMDLDNAMLARWNQALLTAYPPADAGA